MPGNQTGEKNMGGKIFKISLWVITGFFVFFFLVGQVARIRWGKDHEFLKVSAEGFKFEAERDSLGVWNIQAETSDDVSFALGFLQHHDREFQTEMARQMALGNLSSFFGESLLPKDRLMRLTSQVARRVFEKTVQESPDGKKFLKSIESYIAGRKAYFDSGYLKREPFEFSVFGINRNNFEPWEPWHLAALMRAHTWDLSYDIRDEMLRIEILKIFPENVAKSLVPGGPATTLAHYSQPENFKSLNFPQAPPLELRKKLIENAKKNFGPPSVSTSQNKLDSNKQVAFMSSNLWAPLLEGLKFDSIWGFEAEDIPGKGSNLWITKNAGSPVAMCADSHLGTYWPSPLYPARYKIKKDNVSKPTEAIGYFFPGVPWLVQGLLRNEWGDISWGITIANYVDTTDLVEFEETHLGPPVSREIKNEFVVKSLSENALISKFVSETWTDFGPRVDEFLDWKIPLLLEEKRKPLVLDWMGFKDLQDPGLFFFLRSQKGIADFDEDLQKHWHFPAVNLNWISTKSSSDKTHPQNSFEVGHQVTGFIFSDKNKKSRMQNLVAFKGPEKTARSVSASWERPRLKKILNDQDEFFFVSANHKVWDNELSDRLAFQWGDSSRPQSLFDKKSEIQKNPAFGQGISRSGGLIDFYQNLRKKFSAEDLCGPLPPGWVRECYGVLEGLDQWKGETEVSRWEPTFVSLWRNLLGAEIWKTQTQPAYREVNTEGLFEKWRKNLHFRRAMDRFASDFEFSSKNFVDSSPHFWAETLRQSFKKTHELLITNLGEDTRFWSWGRVHKLEWLHPVGQIPGRLGKVLKDSLFGPDLSAPGADDSPLMGNYKWKPSEPLKFSADMAPVLRFCSEGTTGEAGINKFKWANITGPSGNPFSKWSSQFSKETYFKLKLAETEF